MSNIYAQIYKKNINVKDFIEQHYDVVFKSNKANCPFPSHDDKTASFAYNPNKNYAHCFGCGRGGDAITFVQHYEKCSNIEAAKKVCDLEKIAYEENFKTEELSPEQKAQHEAELKKYEEEKKARDAAIEAEDKKLRDKAKKQMATLAPAFAEAYHKFYDRVSKTALELFPNQSDTFHDWAHSYLGYDEDQDTIVTINRVGSEVFNIKHRTKRNKEGELNTGKWIGHYKGTAHPFPLEYFKGHKKNTVVLVEGEKDSLNLLSYDINNLTLGGVSNSWLNHKELLRDKVVYIWFDNDKAGYINAVKKYRELEGVCADIFIVLFYHISQNLPKGYDVSDFLKDRKHKTKDEIFHDIAYSSYHLTNELINEIEDVANGLSTKKDTAPVSLKEYHSFSPLKDFRDIKKEWSKVDKEGNAYNILPVKGELDDEELDDFLRELSASKRDKHYGTVKDIVIRSAYERKQKPDELAESMEKYEKIFNRLMEVKKILITNYRQTHIVDIVRAFLEMAKKSGNTFGKYKGGLYIWTGTHYHYIENLEDLTTWLHNFWFFHAKVDFKKQTERNVKEVVDNIISKAYNINEVKRYQDHRVMNVLNGTLYINKRAKIIFKDAHHKKDCATNILNFHYDESATCPKWSKFLNRVIPDKADQATLMEFIGYCFLPTHNYEAFLFLYGKSGANGKSVIMEVIRNFFGEENTSSLQLQQFYEHQLSSLQNKLINIGSEIDVKGMDKGQLSTLKAIVSPKDAIQINPKNKDPYQLKPTDKPKLVFAGNDKPQGSDVDNAVFRRMLLISFDTEIKDDEKIRDLSERFKDEMSGILNLALKHLQNLVSNGRFTKSERMSAEIEAYKDDINPIRNFVKENVKAEKGCMISKKLAYSFYKEWANEKGYRPFGETNFWKRVKEEIPSIDTTGKQVRYDNEYIGTDKPRFIENLAIISSEFSAFVHNGKTINTNLLNIDMLSREIMIFDDLSQKNGA